MLASGATLATTGLVGSAWHGGSEGWAVALALLALERALAGRHREALPCAVAVCLLQLGAWPFLTLYAAYLGRTRAVSRPWLAAIVLVVPALWFGPELWGGGLLRSGAVPDRTSWADGVSLPLLGALLAAAVGAATVRPGVALPLTVGLVWVGIVAATGLSGLGADPGDHLPGAVALGVAGAVAIAGIARRRDPRWAILAAALALLLSTQAAYRVVEGASDRLDHSQRESQLTDDLREVIGLAGGPRVLRRCGRPVAPRSSGPMLAWYLRTEAERIGVDPQAGGTGAVFHTHPASVAALEPPLPRGGKRRYLRAGRWTVSLPSRCRTPR